MHDFIVGVDLGQANDYTAIAVAEVQRAQRDKDPSVRRVRGLNAEDHSHLFSEKHYQVRHLERLELGTPYPQQVERIQAVMKEVGQAHLVVDQTGVGRPVVDMLSAKGLLPYAISIHGGDQVTHDGREYRVPKRELVSVLQVLLQSKRLRVAKGLSEAHTLAREMLAFKVEISKTGHDTYGNDWRENAHDDLVLAVALMVWFSEARREVRVLSGIFGGF